jgi:tRNA-dihydrouridine synthase 1
MLATHTVRTMVRRHGCTFCYSPMIPVKAFVQLPKDGPPIDPKTGGPATQAAYFTTLAGSMDRPLAVQLGGADPDEMLEAAKLLQGQCDCIDVNCEIRRS